MALSNGSKYLTSPSEIPVKASGSDTERTLGEWAEGIEYSHATVEDLKQDEKLKAGSYARTAGYWAAGEGGNSYAIVASGTGTDDGGSYIDLPASGLQAKGLFPSGVINAAQFGFSVGGGSSDNGDAIYASVMASGGSLVQVHASDTFEMASLSFTNVPVNLEFTGDGRVNRQSGGGRLLTIDLEFTDIEDVSSISRENYTVDGHTTRIDVLNVGDSSQYARGDFVRVVSDDRDPNAAGGGTVDRKFGEIAKVIGVESGKIFLSTPLEDRESYSTDIRVGKYRRDKIRVKGLESDGNISTETGQMIVLYGALFAEIEAAFWGHPWIGFQPVGCAFGNFRLRGDGKGTTDGSLGYLISDVAGRENKYHSPVGGHYRHVFTTNFNSVDDLSANLASYGGSRDITVLDGVGFGCEGVPWDDHSGARRTKFVRCKTYGMLDNNSTARTAFQCRGKDTRIIDPYCDNSVTALIRVSGDGENSTHLVYGGEFNCPMLDRPGPVSAGRQTFHFIGPKCNMKDSQGGLMDVEGNIDVIIEGGVISNTEISGNTCRILMAKNGNNIILKNPTFKWGVSDSGSLFHRPFTIQTGTEACSIVGKCRFERVQDSGEGYSAFLYSSNPEGVIRIAVDFQGDVFNSLASGSIKTLKYAVSSGASDYRTNLTDFDDYLQNLAGF